VRAALTTKPLGSKKRETAAERKRAAAAVAILRHSHLGRGVKPPKPSVATATQRSSTSKGPSHDELLELAVDKGIVKPLQAEGRLPKHKTLGQDIYQQIATNAPYLLFEAPAAIEGLKGAVAAARGVKAGDEVVGGSRLLSKALKPSEATTAADRAAVSARAGEKAAAREASGVRAAARRAGETVTRASSRADAAVARRVAGRSTRRQAAAAAGAPLKAGKVGAAQLLPVVRGHEQAIAEHPGKVAKTTARAIPGLVTVPVGQAAAVGVTAGRAASEGAHALGIPGARGYSRSEIFAPIAGLAKEQAAFARQVAKVVTSDDSKEVQEAVEDELGLMLPIMLGLGTKAAADKLTRGRIAEAVKRVADDTRSAQRKQEAVRVSRATNRARRETQDRTRKIRREAGRAKGSEVLGDRTVRGGRIRRRDKKLRIRTGDIAPWLQRKAIPLDKPEAALAAVRHEASKLKPLPEGATLPRSQITTRDVIGYILKNPEVLKDRHLKAEVKAIADQARYAREHAAELSPEHSERARFVPTAVSADVPLPEERFPNSVRDITRAEPTRGRTAKDVLRRESRSDRVRERRLRRKAATREAKARAITRELAVRERAEPNRVKTNAAVAAKAERLRRQAEAYRASAETAAKEATRKYHAATEIDASLEPEFVQEMEAHLRSEGRPVPEYGSTATAREMPSHGGGGAKMQPFPGRSKFRGGTAEEYGLVREDLGHQLRESIARPVSRRESFKAMRGFLEDNQWKSPAGRTDFTSNEARRIFDEGTIRRDDYVLVPAQLYTRAIDPAEMAAQVKRAMDEDPKGEIAPGRRYRIVRRHATNEFFEQIAGSAILPRIRAVNRATSFLILGTSPAWAAAQVVAELAQGAAAQPRILNPLFVKKAIAAYKAMPEHRRWEFDSWAGVTKGDPIGPGELKLDATTGDLNAAAGAMGVLDRTPLGRFIKSIPRGLQHLDQWKGGRVRLLVGVSKIDRDLNSRLPRFLRGVRGLHDEIAQSSEAMHGKPLSEQLAYVAGHPLFSKRYQGYLDDVLGNWHALTRNEQLASRLLIFYPFIRMAARWTFYAFPKRHPVKAAMLYWLGQQNANELHKLLGGDPTYFTDWAQVPLHLGGKTELLPLSRIAPGTGLATELLGEGTKNLPGLALSSLQPGVATAIIAATGVDPRSGEQKAGRGVAALAQLLNLSPVTRAANAALIPAGRKATDQAVPVVSPIFGKTERQDALDKLFAKLEGNHGLVHALEKIGAPTIPKTLGVEKDLVKLRRILDTISANSSDARRKLGEREEERAAGKSGAALRHVEVATARKADKMAAAYDKAQKRLDAMLAKYRIKADKWTGGVYGIAAYGSRPRTATTFGGATAGPFEPTSDGVSTFGGKRAPGPAPTPVPATGTIREPRPKESTFGGGRTAGAGRVSTFGGRPAR
jgi:hypothetical protein